jgi:hypothetical protein
MVFGAPIEQEAHSQLNREELLENSEVDQICTNSLALYVGTTVSHLLKISIVEQSIHLMSSQL